MESVPEQKPTMFTGRRMASSASSFAQYRPKASTDTQLARLLEQRRELMNAWSDYLDGLRTRGNVVAIKSARHEHA